MPKPNKKQSGLETYLNEPPAALGTYLKALGIDPNDLEVSDPNKDEPNPSLPLRNRILIRKKNDPSAYQNIDEFIKNSIEKSKIKPKVSLSEEETLIRKKIIEELKIIANKVVASIPKPKESNKNEEQLYEIRKLAAIRNSKKLNKFINENEKDIIYYAAISSISRQAALTGICFPDLIQSIQSVNPRFSESDLQYFNTTRKKILFNTAMPLYDSRISDDLKRGKYESTVITDNDDFKKFKEKLESQKKNNWPPLYDNGTKLYEGIEAVQKYIEKNNKMSADELKEILDFSYTEDKKKFSLNKGKISEAIQAGLSNRNDLSLGEFSDILVILKNNDLSIETGRNILEQRLSQEKGNPTSELNQLLTITKQIDATLPKLASTLADDEKLKLYTQLEESLKTFNKLYDNYNTLKSNIEKLKKDSKKEEKYDKISKNMLSSEDDKLIQSLLTKIESDNTKNAKPLNQEIRDNIETIIQKKEKEAAQKQAIAAMTRELETLITGEKTTLDTISRNLAVNAELLKKLQQGEIQTDDPIKLNDAISLKNAIAPSLDKLSDDNLRIIFNKHLLAYDPDGKSFETLAPVIQAKALEKELRAASLKHDTQISELTKEIVSPTQMELETLLNKSLLLDSSNNIKNLEKQMASLKDKMQKMNTSRDFSDFNAIKQSIDVLTNTTSKLSKKIDSEIATNEEQEQTLTETINRLPEPNKSQLLTEASKIKENHDTIRSQLKGFTENFDSFKTQEYAGFQQAFTTFQEEKRAQEQRAAEALAKAEEERLREEARLKEEAKLREEARAREEEEQKRMAAELERAKQEEERLAREQKEQEEHARQEQEKQKETLQSIQAEPPTTPEIPKKVAEPEKGQGASAPGEDQANKPEKKATAANLQEEMQKRLEKARAQIKNAPKPIVPKSEDKPSPPTNKVNAPAHPPVLPGFMNAQKSAHAHHQTPINKEEPKLSDFGKKAKADLEAYVKRIKGYKDKNQDIDFKRDLWFFESSDNRKINFEIAQLLIDEINKHPKDADIKNLFSEDEFNKICQKAVHRANVTGKENYNKDNIHSTELKKILKFVSNEIKQDQKVIHNPSHKG